MKRIKSYYFALFIILLSYLSSCVPIEETPASYIAVNDEQKILKFGEIEDLGTNLQVSVPYRRYAFDLYSSDVATPMTIMGFNLYSKSTTQLADGTYTYGEYPVVAGEFSYVEVGFNMKYDSKGIATDGTVLTETYIDTTVDNTITVATIKGVKTFAFSLNFIKNNIPYRITGDFHETLKEL